MASKRKPEVQREAISKFYEKEKLDELVASEIEILNQSDTVIENS
jgi:hypothetical protein